MNKIVIFLFLSITLLFSEVNLIAPNSFEQNEPYDFMIEADGNSLDFPNIEKIDDFIVQSLGSSSSLTIINGKKSQKISKRFRMFPTKDFKLPSFEIKIDNTTYKTKELYVKQKSAQKTKSSLYDLEISSNKSSLFVGEDLVLKLVFKYSKNSQIVDLNFESPRFENFWSKQLGEPKKFEKDGYIIQELNYLLFPQKSGKLDINPLKIDVVMVDNSNRNRYTFFQTPTKVEKVYSNKLSFDVKALPDNISLIGDFSINTTVDKQEINAGEALSFMINIQGRGNIDDIKEYKLNIPNTTIYENDAKKNYDIKDGKYGGIYQKSFSIVSESDFVIEPIELKFYDKKTATIKKIYTKRHEIKVKQKAKKVEPKIQKAEVLEQKNQELGVVSEVISNSKKIELIVLGIIIGVFLTLLYYYIRQRSKTKDIEIKPLHKRVSKAKTEDELLKVLAPFLKIDKELDLSIYSLELKDDKDFKLKKKEILKRVKFLNL